MQKVISKDGTPIAYEKTGNGPAAILVDGALTYRAFGPLGALAKAMERDFTVYTYDRRGRGESGDTKPFSPEREIEDLGAMIDAAGGSAFLFGVSSGAAIVLEAATRLKGIRKIALYEAPFIVDNTREPVARDYVRRMEEAVNSGNPGVAVDLFMKTVGVPAGVRLVMRVMPAWKKLKATAHTLPYDFAFVNDHQQGKPLAVNGWRKITTPAVLLVGGKSPGWVKNGMGELAKAIPGAQLQSLEGQTHMVKANIVAPVLREFFS